MIGADKYLSAVICGDMVKCSKPDPEIYLTAAREINLPPNQCVAFEDSPNGIKSAFAAGLKAIMIPDMTQPDDEVAPMLSAVYPSLDRAIEFFEGSVEN